MIQGSAPELLVVMPVYNALPFLGQAVNSILGQSLKIFDFLILDDSSTDGSFEFLTRLQDPRIRLERLPHGGPGAAMNHALSIAIREGIPYLARMDADDISAPLRLEKQLPLMQAKQTYAAVSCNCDYINTTGMVIGSSTVSVSPRNIHREIQQGLRGLVQGASLFRVEALATIGGYRAHIPQAEDTDLFLRLSEKFELANLGETLYQIRLHPGSLSLASLELNLRYHLYALRCNRLRRHEIPEPSFADYCKGLPATDQLRLAEEQLFLRLWRKGMLSRNPVYKLLAGLISPRRLFARAARILERNPQ